MAIRHYIGARYVPRFLGTYDVTQIYDALDVVDNGSGTSYIARKTVPAGTPLTDTDYWFVYGASSGAIIQLQNDLIAVENDITSNIKPELLRLNTEIEGLKRNLVIIGNSYVDYGVCDPLKAYFDNVYEYTGSGNGFLPYTGHTTTFEILLDLAINDSSFDNDTITDILFVSAMGDTRACFAEDNNFESKLSAAMAAIKTKISANFTNCTRTCLTLAETRNVAAFTNNPYNMLFKVHRAFKHYSPYHGIEYIGWSGWSILWANSTYIQVDNYHPTADGATVIGEWLTNAYFGNAEYDLKKSESSSVPSDLTATATATIVMQLTPDLATFELRRIVVTNGESITFDNGDLLFDISGLAIPLLPCPATVGNICEHLYNRSTGVSNAFLYLIYSNASTSGLLELKANTNISGTTNGTNMVAPILGRFTYVP